MERLQLENNLLKKNTNTTTNVQTSTKFTPEATTPSSAAENLKSTEYQKLETPNSANQQNGKFSYRDANFDTLKNDFDGPGPVDQVRKNELLTLKP